MPDLSIGETARQPGLSNDTLRYYERIGLLPPVLRDSGGRRRYGRKELSMLGFIKRAQRMNFSLQEIAQLLTLRTSPNTAREDARALTHAKLAETKQRIGELTRLRDELQLLVNLCQGSKAGCPIIDGIAGAGDGAGKKSAEF